MTKVLIDYGTFSAQRFGGISRYYVELARELANCNGIEVKVVAPLYINSYLSSLPGNLRFGRRVPEIKNTGILRDKINRPVSGLYSRWFKPDVVHETFFRVPWSAPKTAKRCVTVYDMIHEQFSDMIPQNERPLFWRNLKIKKDAVARADLIICISECTRRDLTRIYNIPESKTRVIHLSGDVASCDHSDVLSDRPYILYVGNRNWYKNFSIIARAFAVSPELSRDFDLVCFGGGVFSMAERQLFAELKIEDHVRHRSGDDQALAAAYRGARTFVFPSKYEGFGLPLLEAMKANCPVIASRASCFPEIAGNAAEYFEVDSFEDCHRALVSVCYDDERRMSLIEAGKIRHAMFSWRNTAEKTRQVYLELTRS